MHDKQVAPRVQHTDRLLGFKFDNVIFAKVYRFFSKIAGEYKRHFFSIVGITSECEQLFVLFHYVFALLFGITDYHRFGNALNRRMRNRSDRFDQFTRFCDFRPNCIPSRTHIAEPVYSHTFALLTQSHRLRKAGVFSAQSAIRCTFKDSISSSSAPPSSNALILALRALMVRSNSRLRCVA